MSDHHLLRLVTAVGLGAIVLAGCGDTKITLALPTTVAVTTVASPTSATAAGAATATSAAATAATTAAPLAAAVTTTTPVAASTKIATTKAPAAATSTEPPITVDPNKPGNAYIQAPFEALVGDCRAGDSGSCAELDARVARQAGPGEGGPLTSSPLCYFYYQWQSQPDAFVLGYLTKAWATMQPGPAGVTAALATLAADAASAPAADSVKSYVGGICPDGD